MPTEEVTAFPLGEGGGFADGRGLLPSLSGKVSALPPEEVTAFPLGAVIETKTKKVRALCRLGISENGCMRERCRPPQTIVIVGIKGDKEGSTTT